MKKRFLTDQMFYVLLTLIEPSHGYVSMKYIEEATNGTVKIGPATMYRTLDTLLKDEAIQVQGDIDNKKVYVITEKGMNILNENLEYRKEMITFAEKILKEKK